MDGKNWEQALRDNGQGHLTRSWDSLSSESKERLEKQLAAIDWAALPALVRDYVLKTPETHVPSDLTAAPCFPLTPDTAERRALYARAVETGHRLLRDGKVAAFTVAGGQGTRLGYDGPKGDFPITPIRGKTLFRCFAEAIARLSEKYDTTVPWYIMTSEMNDRATRDIFAANAFFGLAPNNVMFLVQGAMPAIGLDGKVLLAAPDALALAPDGHGGSLTALRRSGALDDMRRRGVEIISYFQVDNPLVPAADPLFIGLHALHRSEMSARMLPKTGPFEKLGNFCVSEGRLRVIEYSDLPNALAEERKPDGSLRFIAGSPAIHLIDVAFAERLTQSGRLSLPWHRADKKVPFIDADGKLVNPDKPNAVKLETFIFDAFPLAERTLVLEARREDQFAPVKNREGVDSVVSCREALIARDVRRLRELGGADVPLTPDGKPDCVVELSPRRFVDAEDVAAAAPLPSPARGEKRYYE